MNHFLSIADIPVATLDRVLDVAFELRDQHHARTPHQQVLAGKTLAMIFEKPSLRTRVSFEVAIKELGGHALVLGQHEIGLGKRESAADVARVLGGMVHGIIARVFEHEKLSDFAQYSGVPVINALSDLSHPCQAMADVMTMIDAFGRDVAGKTLTFIGDGNNVARSLAMLCGKLGINFVLASPPGYEIEQSFVDRIMSQAPAMNFETTRDPQAAVRYADVVYTDTWVSMGQEDQKAKRVKVFADYQINAKLMAAAPDHAIVLHCLPAYRNVEITDEVMDGPQSHVFAEAHNRLHAQKGLLAVLYEAG